MSGGNWSAMLFKFHLSTAPARSTFYTLSDRPVDLRASRRAIAGLEALLQQPTLLARGFQLAMTLQVHTTLTYEIELGNYRASRINARNPA
jgi:hypothetical protein